MCNSYVQSCRGECMGRSPQTAASEHCGCDAQHRSLSALVDKSGGGSGRRETMCWFNTHRARRARKSYLLQLIHGKVGSELIWLLKHYDNRGDRRQVFFRVDALHFPDEPFDVDAPLSPRNVLHRK